MSLHLSCLPAPDALAANAVLGGVALGESGLSAPPWPLQQLFAPAATALVECWHSTAVPLLEGVDEGIVWRRKGALLFGVLTLEEALFADADTAPLQAATAAAYERIFRLLAAQGLPHLWRLWNYLADINGEQGGIERYRLFNSGRQQGFAAAGRTTTGSVPAASALGLAQGPLRIAFLAADQAAQALENPRQTNAWRYPPQYGRHSPTFARAALARTQTQEILLVSGTASIVGHASQHAGDVIAQCHETFANLQAVLDEARRHCLRPFELSHLQYRVYLRALQDWPQVQAVLAAYCGNAQHACIEADICRAELLVEIEAAAVHDVQDAGHARCGG